MKRNFKKLKAGLDPELGGPISHDLSSGWGEGVQLLLWDDSQSEPRRRVWALGKSDFTY